MNATHAHLYRYTLPFREPVTVKGSKLAEREGFVLALEHRDKTCVAYAEIAPLPGLHREGLDDAERQLREILQRPGCLRDKALHDELFPSVRTGLEMAAINFDAGMRNQLPRFFPGVSKASVPLNALLFGETETVRRWAEEHIRSGYRTFKLKVSGSDIEASQRAIELLHRLYGTTIELRLDANRSMGLDDAVAFCRNLPKESVAYIEEPLNEPGLIEEFHAKTGILSALDETLWQNRDLAARIPSACLAAYVLKPNCIGGIAKTLELAEKAGRLSLPCVFSSTFESGISLSFYALMAAGSARRPAACGLDTFRFFRRDLLKTPFAAQNALLDVRTLYRKAQEVDPGCLKPISTWIL